MKKIIVGSDRSIKTAAGNRRNYYKSGENKLKAVLQIFTPIIAAQLRLDKGNQSDFQLL